MKTALFHLSRRTALPVLVASILAPLAFAQDAAKSDSAKVPSPMPPIKYDPAPVAQNTPSFAPVVEKVAGAVVTISTSKNVARGANGAMPFGGGGNGNPLFNDPNFRRFFGVPDDNDQQAPPGPNPGRKEQRGGKRERSQPIGLGSGVVVSPEGHILTNNHVIEGADDIAVTIGNDRHEYKATKIGTDPSTDIAVLKIEGKDLPAITFADSDKLRAGDIVLAVGNPFGLTQSATMGVVSAIGRGGMNLVDYENFIQTDAAINMGNSGGALVDYQGRLVGINTAIFSRTGGNQGIGFAVPANLARNVMESILKNGRVVRGFLGVQLQPLTEDLMTAFKATGGALVNDVQSGSPAEKAGVASADVVTEVNGKKVEGHRELQLLIGSLSPGTKVDLKLLRDGQPKDVTVTLGEKPGDKGIAQAEPVNTDPDVLDGVTVSDIDADVRKEFEVPENTKGVIITQIDPDSASAAAGLKRGDVILEVERQAVTSAKQAVEMSEKLKKEKKVLVRVSSGGRTRYVVIEDRK